LVTNRGAELDGGKEKMGGGNGVLGCGGEKSGAKNRLELKRTSVFEGRAVRTLKKAETLKPRKRGQPGESKRDMGRSAHIAGGGGGGISRAIKINKQTQLLNAILTEGNATKGDGTRKVEWLGAICLT